MPAPNDYPSLPPAANLLRNGHGLTLSNALMDLLVDARETYDWPAGTGARVSQQNIIDLEVLVAGQLVGLNPARAHQIVIAVSEWAGNNAKSHNRILAASFAEQQVMERAIHGLITLGRERGGLDDLCNLPGISLVIASKIYRFCSPQIGAAVDRHASYFFNSLPVVGWGNSTNFGREWSSSRRTSSRLRIYSKAGFVRNLDEYFQVYLPLLSGIADALNLAGRNYRCAASGSFRDWAPADVEMAAYYWWACHGAR